MSLSVIQINVVMIRVSEERQIRGGYMIYLSNGTDNIPATACPSQGEMGT